MARHNKLHLLAAQTVKQASNKDSLYKLNDGSGLYLWIYPDGRKSWRLKYRIYSKEKTFTIGDYPQVSLQLARIEAQKARDLITQSIDPVKQRQQDEAERNGALFEQLAMEWYEKEKPKWSESHALRTLQLINADILPQIGKMPLKMIMPQDCLMVIRKVESRGALEVAGRVKQRMKAIFQYGICIGSCVNNPVDSFVNVIQQKPVEHRKMLAIEQLPQFLNDIEQSDKLHFTTRLALKMLVLTFVRSAELRGMRWSEIDIANSQWRIPAERMKMKEAHIVPLSRQALALLEQIKPLSGTYDLVFPSIHSFKKPLSENTLTYAIRKRLDYDATAHGFRALASTLLNEQGFNPDAIERQLAHAERNKIRAAYNRSQYLPERVKMMQAWADYLDSLKAGAQVIPIHAKAG